MRRQAVLPGNDKLRGGEVLPRAVRCRVAGREPRRRAVREAVPVAIAEVSRCSRKLTFHQLARARALIEAGEETRAGIAELFGVDVATLMRAMGKAG